MRWDNPRAAHSASWAFLDAAERHGNASPIWLDRARRAVVRRPPLASVRCQTRPGFRGRWSACVGSARLTRAPSERQRQSDSPEPLLRGVRLSLEFHPPTIGLVKALMNVVCASRRFVGEPRSAFSVLWQSPACWDSSSPGCVGNSARRFVALRSRFCCSRCCFRYSRCWLEAGSGTSVFVPPGEPLPAGCCSVLQARATSRAW